MQSTDAQTLQHLQQLLQVPFWSRAEFWIESLIGSLGVLISYLAYRQAEAAKQEAIKAVEAAKEAGRSVKLQTMSIELTEIVQKLDRVQPGISFNVAKDLFNETSWKLRRVMAPFAENADLRATIEAVKTALEATQASLKLVRPTGPGTDVAAPNAVYLGVEDNFATINNSVADLLGLVEKLANKFGEDHAPK